MDESGRSDSQLMSFAVFAQIQYFYFNTSKSANDAANLLNPKRFVCLAKTDQSKHGFS